MNESQLYGALLPTHPDIIPIVQKIREKYDIPLITTDDKEFLEVLFSDKDIDWEAIHKEVETQIRLIPDLIPENLLNLYHMYDLEDDEPPELKNRNDIPEDIREIMINTYASLRSMFKPIKLQIDEYYKALADRVIEYLMTGRSRAVPDGWIGTVYTMSSLGNRTIVAMIGELGDPKEISAQFRRKYTETFGRDKPKITDETINTAHYITLKLGGMKLRDLADIYIERHPSEFPTNIGSNSYRAAKRKLEERLKKRIDRLQQTITELLRDGN